MRRQGLYPDSSVNTYAVAQMHRISGHRMEHEPDPFQGRLEAFTPEREQQSYATSESEGQWRWERDESNMSNPIASHMFDEGQGGGDASRSYLQAQRLDPKLGLDKGGNTDPRSQPHGENLGIGHGDSLMPQTFDGLQQKFLDDILKLAKEQNDAEDAENARHRETLSEINAQYEEQLTALRARQAGRRDELLQRESHARQHRYQKTMMDPYPKSSITPNDPYGYSGVTGSTSVGEAQLSYDADRFDSYRERARFLEADARDHGSEPRTAYPGGRVYDTGSRYY